MRKKPLAQQVVVVTGALLGCEEAPLGPEALTAGRRSGRAGPLLRPGEKEHRLDVRPPVEMAELD
jgi:hypothetical protein